MVTLTLYLMGYCFFGAITSQLYRKSDYDIEVIPSIIFIFWPIALSIYIGIWIVDRLN